MFPESFQHGERDGCPHILSPNERGNLWGLLGDFDERILECKV